MINIFIALSQHHLDLFEKRFLKKEEGDKNIILSSKMLNTEHELWDEVFLTNFNFHNQSNSKLERIQNIISKIKAYKKLINKIEKYKNCLEIRLYYSSLEDVLTNYLFFSFNKNIEGIVIEDGVLNYYTHTLDNVSKLNTFLKKVFVIPFMLEYTSYKGHTTGIDYHKTLCQYVRMPNSSVRPDKSRELILVKKKIENIKNDILIIGQEPYANIIGASNFERKLKKLFNNVKNSENYSTCNTIYYKPHRNGSRINYSLFKSFFKEKTTIVIDTKNTVENIFFKEIKCRSLFTFDSSSVVNIYAEMDDSNKDEIDINVMPLMNNELSLFFSKMNFKIMNNDI